MKIYFRPVCTSLLYLTVLGSSLTACNSAGGTTTPAPSPTPTPTPTPSPTPSPSPVVVSGQLYFNLTSLVLTRGESTTVQLNLTNSQNVANLQAVLISSNSAIVSVPSGSCILSSANPSCSVTIVANQSGSTTIYATASGYSNPSLLATVPAQPGTISFSSSSLSVNLAESATVNLTLNNSGAVSSVPIVLSSSPSGTINVPTTCNLSTANNVCQVQINGIQLGTTSLSATANGYTIAPTLVNVVMPSTSLISFTSVPSALVSGESYTTTMYLNSSGVVGNLSVLVSSSSSSVIGVSPQSCVLSTLNPSCSVVLTGNQTGSSTVSASVGGVVYESFVTSVSPAINDITFSPNSVNMYLNQSAQINVQLNYSGTVGSVPINFYSSESGVATISPPNCQLSSLSPSCNVTVSGIGIGNASIYATIDGESVSQTVPISVEPLTGWNSLPNTPQVSGRANNIGEALDQYGNIYLSYQTSSNLYVYRYNPSLASSTWQQVAGSLSASSLSPYSSLYLSGVNDIYLGYTSSDQKVYAQYALPDSASWQQQGPLIKRLPYEPANPCITQFPDRTVDMLGSYVALTIPGDNRPYIGFQDNTYIDADTKTMTVESATITCVSPGYSGLGMLTVWRYLGSSLWHSYEKFSAGYAGQIKMAVTPNKTTTYPIFAAYTDASNNNSITVQSLNSSDLLSTWSVVGSAGISGGQVNFITLAVSNSGTPYIAYQDVLNNRQLAVKSYNGSSWQNVGSGQISVGNASYISLAIRESDNVPFIAYQDSGVNDSIIVKYFNSGTNSWVAIGDPIATYLGNYGAYTALQVSPVTGQPIVSFQSGIPSAVNSSASVMFYVP